MPGFSTLTKKFSHPDLPFIIFMGCCLLVGILTFRDYGLSRDEPLFYAYADAIGYAYSIPERTSGEFDIERAYGPSATDHKMYGPAYLLIARNPVAVLSELTDIRKPDLWHLANFITFLSGGVLLYNLCKRWMKRVAAFGAVLLFITQPILWGHAFINPKDIPFMVFMLAALTLGLNMVDRLVDLSPTSAANADGDRRRWLSQKTWGILSIVFAVSLLFLLFFAVPLRDKLSFLIDQAYYAESSSFLGRIFNSLANNAKDIPVEAYINKGLVQFDRVRRTLMMFTMPLLLISIIGAFRPVYIVNTLHKLGEILSPLPTLPIWWVRCQNLSKTLKAILIPGLSLGLAISIRVLGPLAGLLVLIYFLLRYERRSLASLGLYLSVALIVSYATWPFLWDAPIRRFLDVLRHMANNPQILAVLYNAQILPSNELPSSYMPVMLGITLTLPVILLVFTGIWEALAKVYRKQIDWRSLSVVALLFGMLFIYVILLNPPMYDGYRHFLFILPPVFVLAGLGIQFIIERLNPKWAQSLVLLVITVPGVLGVINSHPYQYTYYNILVGGTAGAFRRFETDYWLTCYKEAMQAGINPNPSQFPAIHVLRAPSIAAYYAAPQVNVISYDPEIDQPVSGQKTLLTTRTNVDLSLFPEATKLFSVGLSGTEFCVVKQSR